MPAFTLRQWRLARGLSQGEAARLLGTPFGTVLRWDQGRRQPPPCVALLCRYIDQFGPLPADHGSAPATSAPHAA